MTADPHELHTIAAELRSMRSSALEAASASRPDTSVAIVSVIEQLIFRGAVMLPEAEKVLSARADDIDPELIRPWVMATMDFLKSAEPIVSGEMADVLMTARRVIEPWYEAVSAYEATEATA